MGWFCFCSYLFVLYHRGMSHATDMPAWTYAEAFYNRTPITLSEPSSLRGRIIRGKQQSDFWHLAADGRRLVFTMGSDGLSTLCGTNLRQSLDTIGLTPQYVQGRIEQGFSFKLVVFRAQQQTCTLATWQNLLQQVTVHYPELAHDVTAHANALPNQILPADIEQIDLTGPTHPHFMSLERYCKLTAQERAQNPLALRRLLLHEMHVGTLFGGDGYTYRPDGRKSMKEYLMRNTLLTALQDVAVIDLCATIE
jgi:hypothetical protein